MSLYYADIKLRQNIITKFIDIVTRSWSRFLKRKRYQSCKRPSLWSPNPTRTWNHRSELGPSPIFDFEVRFRPESQVYRISQNTRNCGALKNVMFGYVLSHLKSQPPWPKNWLEQAQTYLVVVNDSTAECSVSQERKSCHETLCKGAIRIKQTI